MHQLIKESESERYSRVKEMNERIDVEKKKREAEGREDEPFVLTGSNRDADIGMASGQQSLFQPSLSNDDIGKLEEKSIPIEK